MSGQGIEKKSKSVFSIESKPSILFSFLENEYLKTQKLGYNVSSKLLLVVSNTTNNCNDCNPDDHHLI